MRQPANPVFWLAWGLPAVAVVASFTSLGLVLAHPDGELPEQYHSEGLQVDRDFTLGQRAVALQVVAELRMRTQPDRCELALRLQAPAPPTLSLRLAHATLPALDQQLVLQRLASQPAQPGGATWYGAACRPAIAAHWHLELTDTTNGWALRQQVRGPLEDVTMDARTSQDD
ncbi:MAG TPA: FixH family protein [Steroidobacteraceae bacterium]|nr:FixH family protein [Steroidobacteraceae bacterium]